MAFCVVRHAEAGIGTVSAGALSGVRVNGWVRVSEFRDRPSDFHLPDYVESTQDLDAEPPAEPAIDDEEQEV